MKYQPAAVADLPADQDLSFERWAHVLSRFREHIDKMVSDAVSDGSIDVDELEEFETKLEVSPPAPIEDIERIDKTLPVVIPISLRQFFQRVSSGIQFRYAFDLGDSAPEGVPSWVNGGDVHGSSDPLFSLEALGVYLDAAHDFAANSGISDFPEELEIWNRSIPFCRFNNSDFLALDPILDSSDPFVILLDHEGDTKLVARNLAGFLNEWPRICFIGPGDYYSLEPFIDEKTGAISGNTHAAIELRRVLKWNP